MNLEPMVAGFLEMGAEVAQSRDIANLHAFRVETKRLRYTLEILAPPGADRWIDKLRTLQHELGDTNDLFVAERYLRGLPRRSRNARPLPAKLRAEALAQVEAFSRSWPRQFSKRVHDEWIKWTKGADHGPASNRRRRRKSAT